MGRKGWEEREQGINVMGGKEACGKREKVKEKERVKSGREDKEG